MTPYYQRDGVTIYCGDCREIVPTLRGVSAVVTDPPYGLSFMGKGWDHGVPDAATWDGMRAALVPGTMLLAFGGTRTFHRLTCAIEDGGYEIRDTIMWVYGSGFPKSHNVGKATEDERWQGWGTALKPAWEPIIVARLPLDGTVAENVQRHGAGAINVDAGRVPASGDKLDGGRISTTTEGWDRPWKHDANAIEKCLKRGAKSVAHAEALGRFPANLIHDGSDEVVGLFPETTSGKQSPAGHVRNSDKTRNAFGAFVGQRCEGNVLYGDTGSAARFFYTAKASPADRGHEEWDALPLFGEPPGEFRNEHPTVKPLALMRYLLTLTMHNDSVVLDPFAGSGTTLVAAKQQGRTAIGIEIEERYCEIAAKRLEAL